MSFIFWPNSHDCCCYLACSVEVGAEALSAVWQARRFLDEVLDILHGFFLVALWEIFEGHPYLGRILLVFILSMLYRVFIIH